MSAGESDAGSTLANPRFTTTHWSVVLGCGCSDTTNSRAALDQLCRAYWYPLYAYVRRRGYSVEESEDLIQEFFARLIEKEWIAEADHSKGRFRTFLLTALSHFLAKEWRRTQAAKRGGGQRLVSLDDTAEARYAQEPASNATPEKLYEQRWALSVFDHALNSLREQYSAVDKRCHYDCLKRFLSAQPEDGDYAAAASELGLSQGAVATAVHRLRQHYRELVREEVVQTLGSPEELEDEMRWLLQALN